MSVYESTEYKFPFMITISLGSTDGEKKLSVTVDEKPSCKYILSSSVSDVIKFEPETAIPTGAIPGEAKLSIIFPVKPSCLYIKSV